MPSVPSRAPLFFFFALLVCPGFTGMAWASSPLALRSTVRLLRERGEHHTAPRCGVHVVDAAAVAQTARGSGGSPPPPRPRPAVLRGGWGPDGVNGSAPDRPGLVDAPNRSMDQLQLPVNLGHLFPSALLTAARVLSAEGGGCAPPRDPRFGPAGPRRARAPPTPERGGRAPGAATDVAAAAAPRARGASPTTAATRTVPPPPPPPPPSPPRCVWVRRRCLRPPRAGVRVPRPPRRRCGAARVSRPRPRRAVPVFGAAAGR